MMTIDALSARIPPALIKQREQGGATLNYVEWSTVVQRLNEICHTDWAFKVMNCTDDGAEACVWGALTVEGTTRENMGFEDNNAFWKTPGSRYKSAVSDCIKRCAAMFGMGLELYHDLPDTTMPDVITPEQGAQIIKSSVSLDALGEGEKATGMLDYLDSHPKMTGAKADEIIDRLKKAVDEAEAANHLKDFPLGTLSSVDLAPKKGGSSEGKK